MVTPDLGDYPLVRSRSVGDVRIHAVEAGFIRLDGGAMFGVVPKPLWEKRIGPDERNRIPLAMRCLLVESPDSLVLVDTGAGNKEDERFRDIYGVDNPGRPTRLQDGIRAAGFEPEDVDVVVNTHLHFDHAGGNTVLDADGDAVPAFPDARYVVQRGEFQFAHSGNPRIRASYVESNYRPVHEAGLLDLVEGEVALTEGIRLVPTPGHTPHHQSVLVESGGEKAFYLADVCPTAAHVPLAWVMGFDVEPLRTVTSKEELWSRALAESWLLIFEHDPEIPWGRIDAEMKSVVPDDGGGDEGAPEPRG